MKSSGFFCQRSCREAQPKQKVIRWSLNSPVDVPECSTWTMRRRLLVSRTSEEDPPSRTLLLGLLSPCLVPDLSQCWGTVMAAEIRDFCWLRSAQSEKADSPKQGCSPYLKRGGDDSLLLLLIRIFLSRGSCWTVLPFPTVLEMENVTPEIHSRGVKMTENLLLAQQRKLLITSLLMDSTGRCTKVQTQPYAQLEGARKVS